MKVIEMRAVTEADGPPSTKEEADVAIAGVCKELMGQDPGTYTIYVGGDLLVYGTVEADGKIVLYHTKVVRVSTSVDDAEPEDPIHFTGAAPSGKS